MVLFFISLFIDDYMFRNGSLFKYYILSLIGYYIFSLFSKSEFDTPGRKLQMASFGQSMDPTIYGHVKVNIKKAKKFVQGVADIEKKKITMTLFFAKVAGEVFNKFPDCDNTIKFGLHAPRSSTDVCVLVNVNDGGNLGAVTLRDVNNKTIGQLHNELYPNINNIRTGKDKEFRENNKLGELLPSLY
jgi:hypothetical protein